MPTSAVSTPIAGTISGKTRPWEPKATWPRIRAATSVTAYDSNRSAAMPAQSPTLSPTLSAMVAALRGSSSGMPCSTLPTRSAPTSAALVKMPPPTRMNMASSAPPKAKPSSTRGASSSKTSRTMDAPSRPRPTVNMPTTPPARNASRSARLVPDSLAALATRRLVRVARVMPMKPTSAEKTAPTRKKMGRPTRTAVVSDGSRNSSANTSRANRARVRNWRLR